MSTVTIHLPDGIEANLANRVKTSGASSTEEYLLRLVEWDVAAGELDSILTDRMKGPFAPLEANWKERVRNAAAPRASA